MDTEQHWQAYPITVYSIDDQRSTTMGIKKMLEGMPYIDFHACNQPEHAMQHILKVGPTVILLDIHMPLLGGFELLQQLRQHETTRHIPVLILSVDHSAESREKAFALGANDYLLKTPGQTEFISRLRYHSRAYIDHLEREANQLALKELQGQLQQSFSLLEGISSLDGLTDVANRRFFDDLFQREWQRSLRETSALSLIFIDIDDFKAYNAHYGHLAGDDCLKEVAKALQQDLKRPSDLIARYASEEFVVLLPNTHGQGAVFIAERLRKTIEALNLEHQTSRCLDYVSISLGVVTTTPKLKHQPHDFLQTADQALFEAKEQGRNQVIAKNI
ncbi:MAG: diguanylate cyclase [Mariprofundaceae bacterium]|nr:diguanylate cyclase [Mariprofundaceae bacterium]